MGNSGFLGLWSDLWVLACDEVLWKILFLTIKANTKQRNFIYLFIFFCNYNSCYCSFDVQEAVILWHFYCLLQLCMALDWQHLLIMLIGQLQVHYVGERERENPEVHESIKLCRCVAGNLLLLSTLNMPWFSIQLN